MTSLFSRFFKTIIAKRAIKSKRSPKASAFIGVSKNGSSRTNPWRVRVNGKSYGVFADEVDAAKHYDKTVVELGLDKPLNFEDIVVGGTS
jgi:hypothetical protein